ncbi:MAG: outer membrane beta-barrel protein [Gallionella sp.]
MKKIAIAALLCGFVATPVLAKDLSPVYVEAGMGVATYQLQTSPRDIRLAAGFRVNPNWAIEASGSYLGGSSSLGVQATNITSVKTMQLAVVGSYPVSKDFDWVGKLGVSRNTPRQTGTGTPPGAVFPTIKDLYWAVGGDFHINSNLDVRALLEDFGAIGTGGFNFEVQPPVVAWCSLVAHRRIPHVAT